MDAKIWSTSLLRGPLLYAENFLKSGTPDPRVLSRSDCNKYIENYKKYLIHVTQI